MDKLPVWAFITGSPAIFTEVWRLLAKIWKVCEEDEAEGGAKIILGPSLNLAPSHSYFSFSLSGGPVMYVTRSPVTNPNAIRELPSENGLTLRARIIYTI